MGIYEHLVNHILSKYKTILLSSLHVMKVLLHIYFGNYDQQFSTVIPTSLNIWEQILPYILWYFNILIILLIIF